MSRERSSPAIPMRLCIRLPATLAYRVAAGSQLAITAASEEACATFRNISDLQCGTGFRACVLVVFYRFSAQGAVNRGILQVPRNGLPHLAAIIVVPRLHEFRRFVSTRLLLLFPRKNKDGLGCGRARGQ